MKLSLPAAVISTQLGSEMVPDEVKIQTGPVLLTFDDGLLEPSSDFANQPSVATLLESYANLLPSKFIVELPTLAIKATNMKYSFVAPFSTSPIVASLINHNSQVAFQLTMDIHSKHDSPCLETLQVQGFTMQYVIPFQLQQSISIDIKFKEIQFGISSLTFQIIKEYLSNNNAAASNPLKVSLSIEKLASKLILQGNQTLVIEATELFFELDHPAIQLNIKTVSVTDTARSERILSSWFSPQQLPSSNVISVNATLGDGRHTLLELLHVSIDPIEIVFRESLRKSLKLFLKQDVMQNERKGESKSVKLKNVFISRIGMLVTYSFLRKSKWLMDSFQVKEFNGTYQDFISAVLGNATWSVFKSFIGLQGQKFSSMEALGTYAASSSMSQSSTFGNTTEQSQPAFGNNTSTPRIGSLSMIASGSTNSTALFGASSPAQASGSYTTRPAVEFGSAPVFDPSPEGTPLALPHKRKLQFFLDFPKRVKGIWGKKERD